jgi:hypothetical protein
MDSSPNIEGAVTESTRRDFDGASLLLMAVPQSLLHWLEATLPKRVEPPPNWALMTLADPYQKPN